MKRSRKIIVGLLTLITVAYFLSFVFVSMGWFSGKQPDPAAFLHFINSHVYFMVPVQIFISAASVWLGIVYLVHIYRNERLSSGWKWGLFLSMSFTWVVVLPVYFIHYIWNEEPEEPKIRKETGKSACPVCGYLTIEKPRDHEVCPVCSWEDDERQFADPCLTGEANGISLNEAKENFIRIGAISEEFLGDVRDPEDDEIPG